MRFRLPFGTKASKVTRALSPDTRPSGAIIANGAFAADGPRTYVVFGVPRGGTTMVGGALRGLGLHMGDDVDPENQEDRAFNLNQGATEEKMRAAIAERNAAHDVWGWKFPRASTYLGDLLEELRAPRLICVFRDSVANAQHGIGKPNLPDFERMRVHLNLTQKNYQFLARSGLPSLSISYEKAIARPRAFIEEMGAFTGHPPDFDAFDFEGFMEPGGYKSFEAYRKNKA